MTECHQDEQTMLRDALAQVQMLETVVFRDGPIDLITATEWGEETATWLREWYNDLKSRLQEKLATDQAALTKLREANARLTALKTLSDSNISKAYSNIFQVKSTLFVKAFAPLLDKSYPSTPENEPI